MALTPNRTKAKLRAGQTVFGSEIMFPSADVAELLSSAGLDFVYIDTEHSATSLESLTAMIRATELGGATPLVRLPENPAGSYGPEIMRILDQGAMGVIVPQVDDARTARAVVAAVKYAPEGTRGMYDMGRTTGFGFALSPAEYLRQANAETMVVVMVESATAIANIAEIVAVPGIDVVLIGSSDLSQSLGHPGEFAHPRLIAAIDTVIAAAGPAAVAVGVGSFAAFAEPQRQRFIAAGARFFNVSTASLLIAGITHWTASLRAHGAPITPVRQR